MGVSLGNRNLGNGFKHSNGFQLHRPTETTDFDMTATGNYTICFTINVGSTGTQRPISQKQSGANSSGWLTAMLQQNQGYLRLYGANQTRGNIYGGAVLTQNAISRVVFIKKGLDCNNWQMWLNGVQVGGVVQNTLLSNDVTYGSGTFYLMTNFVSSCTMIDFKFFKDYCLIPEESIYYCQSTLTPPNAAQYLIANYDMNQKNGTSIIDSKNGYNVTAVGYTDAQVAINGQPQSGQIAWVDGYTNKPILF